MYFCFWSTHDPILLYVGLALTLGLNETTNVYYYSCSYRYYYSYLHWQYFVWNVERKHWALWERDITTRRRRRK